MNNQKSGGGKTLIVVIILIIAAVIFFMVRRSKTAETPTGAGANGTSISDITDVGADIDSVDTVTIDQGIQ